MAGALAPPTANYQTAFDKHSLATNIDKYLRRFLETPKCCIVEGSQPGSQVKLLDIVKTQAPPSQSSVSHNTFEARPDQAPFADLASLGTYLDSAQYLNFSTRI
jgi:hypothetical protein